MQEAGGERLRAKKMSERDAVDPTVRRTCRELVDGYDGPFDERKYERMVVVYRWARSWRWGVGLGCRLIADVNQLCIQNADSRLDVLDVELRERSLCFFQIQRGQDFRRFFVFWPDTAVDFWVGKECFEHAVDLLKEANGLVGE